MAWSDTRNLLCWLALVTSTGWGCEDKSAPVYIPRRHDAGMLGADAGADLDDPKTQISAQFTKWGDPAGEDGFDPRQVYVLGEFPGMVHNIDAYGSPCEDRATGVADWSSPHDDWRTVNGMTVAVPCDTYDHRLRIDGSMVFEFALRAVRLFVQETPIVGDDGSFMIRGVPEAGAMADPEIALCGSQTGFRHFLDPVDGSLVLSCNRQGNALTFERWIAKAREGLALPAGYEPLHLGYDGNILVQGLQMREDLGVWNPRRFVEVPTGQSFDATRISAVRATENGFMLLVIEDEDPPTLALWRISNDGAVEWGTAYPGAASGQRIMSRCRRIGPPTTAMKNAPPILYAHESGCVCALEPSGIALCMAFDADDSQMVLRFDPDATQAEVALRTDERLLTINRLVTGP